MKKKKKALFYLIWKCIAENSWHVFITLMSYIWITYIWLNCQHDIHKSYDCYDKCSDSTNRNFVKSTFFSHFLLNFRNKMCGVHLWKSGFIFCFWVNVKFWNIFQAYMNQHLVDYDSRYKICFILLNIGITRFLTSVQNFSVEILQLW